MKVILGRLSRYKRCGKSAALRLARTGAVPAMRHGASVLGFTRVALKAARSFVCGARGEMRGRCTFARLRLASYDPGALLATDPILDWAKAVWDGLASEDDMHVAWRRALPTIASATRPFAEVIGPAGAMVASAARIGWQTPSHHTFLDSRGALLDLRNVPLGCTATCAARPFGARGSNFLARVTYRRTA